MRHTLDLDIRPQWQLLDRDARPSLAACVSSLAWNATRRTNLMGTYRLRVLEEGVVDFVHGGEVLHRGEVDVYFDDCTSLKLFVAVLRGSRGATYRFSDCCPRLRARRIDCGGLAPMRPQSTSQHHVSRETMQAEGRAGPWT